MPENPDPIFPEEKVALTEKAKSVVARLFKNKEIQVEKDAFDHPWDEEMCLALKTEIESKPEGIDVDKIITTAYERLSSLLGPHGRDQITINNIKNRLIFTNPDTLMSFRYLYEQPGENSDKYWNNPIERMAKTRGLEQALRIVSSSAISYGLAGIVMIPNDKELLEKEEGINRQYIEKQGIGQKDYAELVLKRRIAHELIHYLYSKQLLPHYPLDEPITDYIASLVFPEIQGIDVRLAWAKASVEEYLRELSYKTAGELTCPIQRGEEQSKKGSSFEIAMTTRKKYFSKLSYQNMGFLEETLNKIGLSKFSPLPK